MVEVMAAAVRERRRIGFAVVTPIGGSVAAAAAVTAAVMVMATVMVMALGGPAVAGGSGGAKGGADKAVVAPPPPAIVSKAPAPPLPPASAPPVSGHPPSVAAEPTSVSKIKTKSKSESKGNPGADVAKRSGAGRKATERSNAASAADGPSSPPLDIGALRAEVHRESHHPAELGATELPETKVEKMLAEVAKAREALHDDTLKLEALVAAAALKPAPPSSNPDDEGTDEVRPRAEGEAAAGAGKPAAKNPLDVLAKALRGIKPEQAAPIVTRLDPQLAATVLQRMPPVDAGKILAAMKAESAAELATLIAARKPRGEARASAAGRSGVSETSGAAAPAAKPPAVAAAASASAAGGPNVEDAPPSATGARK